MYVTSIKTGKMCLLSKKIFDRHTGSNTAGSVSAPSVSLAAGKLMISVKKKQPVTDVFI